STGQFQYETEAVAADLATRFDIEGAVAAGSAGENAGGANTAHRSGHPQTMFGYVVEALRRRREAGNAPFTVMSCDNVRGNGDLARRMILAYARRRDENGLHAGAPLADWIESEVAFPNS